MELNYGKTLNVLSVMHTEFVSTMRGCQAGTENIECLNVLSVMHTEFVSTMRGCQAGTEN
jgi:hypothetical protein